ncbi:hypothetical protein BP5796_02258 [Coleophoma crateriformis]|uniref:Ig-like domain-containing protein n=1 Tax=Coleophoma crateriformis TaxID=565419 RepID=A0A3D8SXQ4_9HELO|nr:hypothetical protein BP5796_02258 [Coleophoma crateriformis]
MISHKALISLLASQLSLIAALPLDTAPFSLTTVEGALIIAPTGSPASGPSSTYTSKCTAYIQHSPGPMHGYPCSAIPTPTSTPTATPPLFKNINRSISLQIPSSSPCPTLLFIPLNQHLPQIQAGNAATITVYTSTATHTLSLDCHGCNPELAPMPAPHFGHGPVVHFVTTITVEGVRDVTMAVCASSKDGSGKAVAAATTLGG